MIPFAYSFHSLLTRRLTTSLTSLGMALVVFVFASSLMLAEGLRKTLVETGSYDNVVVIRKGSSTEIVSGVDRLQASIVETQAGIAIDERGRALLAKEMVVLISLPKRSNGQKSNVVIRGTEESSLVLRPQVKLVRGRRPRPGSSEIMAGQRIAERFKGGGLGENLRFGMRDWTVVGIFDAGNTGFSSEIWGDGDQLMQAFRRPVFSSLIFKLAEASAFDQVKTALENDPRLTLEARRENLYYEDQSKLMAKFLSILGLSLTICFSLGAIIGAIITMYGAVANRTREIGTLRALGFQRSSILLAFVVESLLLGFLGGCVGLFFASFLQLFTISTTNFQTFAELAFTFSLNYEIAIQSLGFSLLMGLIGGLFPAFRASRLNIVEALRAS